MPRTLHDVQLLRVGGTIDTVIVTDRAVIAITRTTRAMAEDAALDLADFHPFCRGIPVIPVLLRPANIQIRPQFPLPLSGAAPVVEATEQPCLRFSTKSPASRLWAATPPTGTPPTTPRSRA